MCLRQQVKSSKYSLQWEIRREELTYLSRWISQSGFLSLFSLSPWFCCFSFIFPFHVFQPNFTFCLLSGTTQFLIIFSPLPATHPMPMPSGGPVAVRAPPWCLSLSLQVPTSRGHPHMPRTYHQDRALTDGLVWLPRVPPTSHSFSWKGNI